MRGMPNSNMWPSNCANVEAPWPSPEAGETHLDVSRTRSLLPDEMSELIGGDSTLHEAWWWCVVTLSGALSSGVAALCYRMREAARLKLISISAQALPQGGTVRYRSVDRRGKATAEWEVCVPAPPPREGFAPPNATPQEVGRGDLPQ